MVASVARGDPRRSVVLTGTDEFCERPVRAGTEQKYSTGT
jgi:hypothetical protein